MTSDPAIRYATWVRRLAALLLLGGFLATLFIAARHNHLDRTRAHHGDACVYCSGAMTAAPVPPATEPPASVVVSSPLERPALVEKQYLLPLAHSGCAPPRA